MAGVGVVKSKSTNKGCVAMYPEVVSPKGTRQIRRWIKECCRVLGRRNMAASINVRLWPLDSISCGGDKEDCWADAEWYSKTISIYDWAKFRKRSVKAQKRTVFHEVCHLLVPDIRMLGHGKYWRELMVKCGLKPSLYAEDE